MLTLKMNLILSPSCGPGPAPAFCLRRTPLKATIGRVTKIEWPNETHLTHKSKKGKVVT